MEVVKFTETVFSSRGKQGIIKPDSDGYYELVVGGLNTYNSAGEYYTAEGALQLFENSSHFMRRIKNGALYSELGHPKKTPDMSMEQFYNRVITIEETNICGHFSEIRLDFDFGKKNPDFNNSDLIGIIAKVKPAGAKANALQLSLEDPKQNTAFSIRGLTENKYKNGRVERRLTNVICFDHVVEGGIATAHKAFAPGLEHRVATESMFDELMDTTIDKTVLKRVLNNNLSHVGMESSHELFKDIMKSMESRNNSNKLSAW
jgi:hypothetical protein